MKTNMTNGQIELVEVFSDKVLGDEDSKITKDNLDDVVEEVYMTFENYEYTDVPVPDYNDVLAHLKNKID